MSEHHSFLIHISISDNGLRYKSFIRGIDQRLYARFASDESKNLDIPALLVLAEYDYASVPQFQLMAAEKHFSKRRVERLQCSHWIPTEKPGELVELLDGLMYDCP